MSRILSALVLAGALVLGGCQNPDGSTNWGNTLLLGAGIGAAAALVAGAASDDGGTRRHAHRYPRSSRYSHGYGGGRHGW